MAKYGKVNGPYFDNGIPVGVRISEYDDSGKLISRKSIGYKKYLAGVDKGEHQYLTPPHLSKRPADIIIVKGKSYIGHGPSSCQSGSVA